MSYVFMRFSLSHTSSFINHGREETCVGYGLVEEILVFEGVKIETKTCFCGVTS